MGLYENVVIDFLQFKCNKILISLTKEYILDM